MEEGFKRSSWGERSAGDMTWTGYPLEEAHWINEKNFTSPAGFRKQMQQDRPMEETDKPPPSTNASLALCA